MFLVHNHFDFARGLTPITFENFNLKLEVGKLLTHTKLELSFALIFATHDINNYRRIQETWRVYLH